MWTSVVQDTPDWLLWVEYKVIPRIYKFFCADKVKDILEGDVLDSGRDLLASGGQVLASGGQGLMDSVNGDIHDSGNNGRGDESKSPRS